MNIAQIENNLQKLIKSLDENTFIYDLLLAYGFPKASIKRLQQGGLNLSKVNGEIDWKKKLFFKEVESDELYTIIDAIKSSKNATKHDPRFVIVTDYKKLLAIDTKTSDSLDIEILEIAKHYDFFLPWAGMEKAQLQTENPADVKAAEKMAKLFDGIKKDNPTTTQEEVHNLNVFLSRLLFCFFAEDTSIFPVKGQFTHGVESHTQEDGSDLNEYLDKLFGVLNTDNKQRKDLPAYLEAFPYVNGGLFRDKHTPPIFTRKSRQALIDCGDLDWSAINPDIFGSMIQAVVDPEHRGGMGMHYTSVPNIMKVIEPLFLNELYEEFEAGKNEPKKLRTLLERISKIKIFDPACGSGNFLIIAYKELRILEIKILQQQQLLYKAVSGFEAAQLELIPKAQLTLAGEHQQTLFSIIELSNFYGIELDDFAHEIAILSLWLAQHQMNQKFKEVFGTANPTLPLQAGGNVVHGNATRLSWEMVCPKREGDEIYILGNPPYIGARNQDKNQKEDMNIVFDGREEYKDSDYIACWLLKGAKFIKDVNSKYSFVSTNSICQGEQVAYYWPAIFQEDLEIFFAHTSFKWTNNAKSNAGVTCIIIGVQNNGKGKKFIFNEGLRKEVANITPYLTSGATIFVNRASKPLTKIFPQMVIGSMARDGGNLILLNEEKNFFIKKYPETKRLIRKLFGSQEFIQGSERWCFWINDEQVDFAKSIPEINDRIQRVYNFRIESPAKTTNVYASIPHKFAQRCLKETNAIIVPSTSSENREYIPIGFLDTGAVITNSANAIYDAQPFIFGIISSKIHNVWVRSIGGQLETRIRYSTEICYNTFPFPEINEQQKQEIEKHVYRILEEREKHSDKTIAQLYDPDKMPQGLRDAHHQLDLAVEQCYRSKPFDDDEERLAFLFKLYEQMVADEKEKGTLFEGESKIKKKTKTKQL